MTDAKKPAMTRATANTTTSAMTCLDVRRQQLANPDTQSAAMHAHLSQCESCREHGERLLAQDARLRDALQVPVPEGLVERALLRRQLRSPQRFRNWMIAASVACLALFAAWWQLPWSQSRDWALLVAEHVADEPAALAARGEIAAAELNKLLHSWGLALREPLGKLRYLDRCAMPDGRGLHAVIATEQWGLVTLILPPAGVEVVPGEAQYGDFHAAAFHSQGRAIAVVTADAAQLSDARQWLETRLTAL